jgi:hypothetical protein
VKDSLSDEELAAMEQRGSVDIAGLLGALSSFPWEAVQTIMTQRSDDVPRLVAEVRRLQALIEHHHLANGLGPGSECLACHRGPEN